MKIIRLKNVSKKYSGKYVFNLFTYDFMKGNIYLFLGENGCGKTTLLKALLGLVLFSSGHIDKGHLKFAFLPEQIYLPETVSVRAFLLNIAEIKCITNPSEIIETHLLTWNLAGEKSIYALSKGMRQKVLIIQMLLDDADIYYMDEPLSGLDHKSRKHLLNIIQNLRSAGKTIFISSHYPDCYFYDIVLHFIDGEIHEGFNKVSC